MHLAESNVLVAKCLHARLVIQTSIHLVTLVGSRSNVSATFEERNYRRYNQRKKEREREIKRERQIERDRWIDIERERTREREGEEGERER